MHKSHLQEPKRSSPKLFLVFSGQFWTKISFGKKKVSKIYPKMPKNAPNLGFFKFQNSICCRKWPICTTNVPACPKSSPEFFILPNSTKIHEKMLPPQKKVDFLGAGKIIKCRKIQKCLNMIGMFVLSFCDTEKGCGRYGI